MANRRMVGEPRDEEIDWELPHMKYARDAVDTMGTTEQDDHFRMEHDLYDDDAEDLYQGFERPDFRPPRMTRRMIGRTTTPTEARIPRMRVRIRKMIPIMTNPLTIARTLCMEMRPRKRKK